MTPVDNEFWRGGVNAWECDEMGHLNTRFYVARAMEALNPMLSQFGTPGLFAPCARSTVRLRQMHIRFLREARAGTPLRVLGDVLAVGDHSAELLLTMQDTSTQEIKATFRMALDHVATGEARDRLAWSAAFVERARERTVALPEHAAPRSSAFGPVDSQASLERARQLGLVRIGLGSIGPDRVDGFGRMVPQAFVGAVSDGIRNLTAPLREIVAAHADPRPDHVGGAVLEFRIVHFDWPRQGDCYEIRSGVQSAEGSVQSLIHWMVDPVGGRVYGTMQAVAVVFDIDRRKAVRVTEAARAELDRLIVPGLAL